MPNGSLDTHLRDTVNLTPEVRVQVACDVSSALTYLHTGTDRVVIHRDVKRCVCVCVCLCLCVCLCVCVCGAEQTLSRTGEQEGAYIPHNFKNEGEGGNAPYLPASSDIIVRTDIPVWPTGYGCVPHTEGRVGLQTVSGLILMFSSSSATHECTHEL